MTADLPNRVLLVDDDLFLSSRILSVLQRLGFRAETARELRIAEEKTRAGVDLVILNYGSAVMGNVDTVRALKGAGAPRLLAFLSHTLIPEVRDEVLSAGADQIVPRSAVSQRMPEILARIMVNQPLPDGLDEG